MKKLKLIVSHVCLIAYSLLHRKFSNIKKIINSLDDTTNQPSKFRAKIGLKKNDES